MHACLRTLAQSLETCELVAPCIASNRMARFCCSTLCRGLDYDIIDTVQTLDPHPACTLLTSCLRLVLSLEAASPPPVLRHICLLPLRLHDIDTVQTLDSHPACTLLTSCLCLSLEAASPSSELRHISACFH